MLVKIKITFMDDNQVHKNKHQKKKSKGKKKKKKGGRSENHHHHVDNSLICLKGKLQSYSGPTCTGISQC